MKFQHTFHQILRFFRKNPVALLAGFLLNNLHFGLFVWIVLYVQNKPIEFIIKNIVSLSFSILVAVLAGAIIKLIVINLFNEHFHSPENKRCVWCGQENILETTPKYSGVLKQFKQNLVFSFIILMLLITAWLPIFSHHLWIGSRFEMLAFVMTLTFAIIVSVSSGIAELFFANSIISYRLSWTNALLLTANFLIIQWKALVIKLIQTSLIFTIIILVIATGISVLPFGLVLVCIVAVNSIFQIFWLSYIHQTSLTLKDYEALLRKVSVMGAQNR